MHNTEWKLRPQFKFWDKGINPNKSTVSEHTSVYLHLNTYCWAFVVMRRPLSTAVQAFVQSFFYDGMKSICNNRWHPIRLEEAVTKTKSEWPLAPPG